MSKLTQKERARLAGIERRWAEFQATHGSAIKENKFVHLPAQVVSSEIGFALRLVRRLDGMDESVVMAGADPTDTDESVE